MGYDCLLWWDMIAYPITHSYSIPQSSPRSSNIGLSLDQIGSLEIETDYSNTCRNVNAVVNICDWMAANTLSLNAIRLNAC